MFAHTKTVIKNISNSLFLLRFLFEVFGANFPEARLLHNYYVCILHVITFQIFENKYRNFHGCMRRSPGDNNEILIKNCSIRHADGYAWMHHAPTRWYSIFERIIYDCETQTLRFNQFLSRISILDNLCFFLI